MPTIVPGRREEDDATLDEVLRTMIEHQHSRLPVYRGTPEKIVGILFYKDLLPLWVRRRAAIAKGRRVPRDDELVGVPLSLLTGYANRRPRLSPEVRFRGSLVRAGYREIMPDTEGFRAGVLLLAAED